MFGDFKKSIWGFKKIVSVIFMALASVTGYANTPSVPEN